MSQSFYGSFYVTNFVKPHKYFEKYLFLIPDTCHAILRCKPVYGFALRESLLSQIFKISVNHFRTSSILLDSTQPLILDFYHTSKHHKLSTPISVTCLTFTYLPCSGALNLITEACYREGLFVFIFY